MAQICITYPPPSYQDIISQIDFPTIDFSKITGLIDIIKIPDPIYPDISQYSQELSQIIQYWKNYLSVDTLFAMIKPMVSLLGLDLSSLLPTIPYLNISILDLIDIDPTALREQISDLIKQYGDDFLNAFSAFLPIPIYFDLSIPSFDVNNIIKAIYNMSTFNLINICTGLISSVLSKLKINAVLSLPTIPSLSDLQAMIMSIISEKIAEITGTTQDYENEYEAMLAMLSNLDLSMPDIFSLISFTGLIKISFPDPFFPDFSSYSIELREMMNIYMQEIYAQITEKIVDFVKSVLGILGISFPSVCIDLPEIEIVGTT